MRPGYGVLAVTIRIKLLAGTAALSVAILGSSGTAFAENDPFLCPVVGDGVLNADSHNGDNGVAAITPPVGTSFLPGNNQVSVIRVFGTDGGLI